MGVLIGKEPIKLKSCSEINEKMIQEFISKNPSCLGLGTGLELKKKRS